MAMISEWLVMSSPDFTDSMPLADNLSLVDQY